MKLDTIQKRNNLNTVTTAGAPGPGGAYHGYDIMFDGVAGLDISDDTKAIGHFIEFQKGPRSNPDSVRGLLDTDLLEIVRHRLQCFQQGEYACRENAIALTHLEEALLWMNKRVEDRAERGVLGTTQK